MQLLDAGAPGLHFFTLNASAHVQAVLSDLDLESGALRRPLPWRQSQEGEEIRPIHWANRPKSYIYRTRIGEASGPGLSSGATAAANGVAAGAGAGAGSGAGSASGTRGRPTALSGGTGADVAAAGGTPASPAVGRWSDLPTPDEYLPLADELQPIEPVEERRSMWGEAPLTVQDINDVFANYVQGLVPRLPWCETGLMDETSSISDHIVNLNRRGFLTINSQPRVNGARSDDPVFGWGGARGYVYQKAYVECFASPTLLAHLMECASDFPSVTFNAVDSTGNTYTNSRSQSVQAVTWGVFPGREVLQPTVVDPQSFLVWKEESFALWLKQWASIYDEDSPSHDLIHRIHDTYFLVAVVDNDFVSGDVFGVFEAALKRAGR